MAETTITALEIGTAKVLALVGEREEDGHVLVRGVGEEPASGVRKAEICDMEHAVTCIRAALREAEKSARESIRRVHLALSGAHVQTTVNRGSTRVMDPNRGVTQDDVERVAELAGALNLPADREVIHTFRQEFRLDDQEDIVNPEGMSGAKLCLDILAVHGLRTRLQNAQKAVQAAGFDVQDVAFSGVCAALGVLTPPQRERGVVVLDVGAGTTDYLAFCGGGVAAAGAVPVGGDHLTNDIGLAFGVPGRVAEELKRSHGTAVVSREARGGTVTCPADVGFPERIVDVESLQTVTHARADELLRLVRDRLDRDRLLPRIGAGVVLTGGGARLREIAPLAQRVFGLPAVLSGPTNASGVLDVTEKPECATAVGLIRYAARYGRLGGISDGIEVGDVIKRIGRLWKRRRPQ